MLVGPAPPNRGADSIQRIPQNVLILFTFQYYIPTVSFQARGVLRGTPQDGNGMRYLRTGFVTPPPSGPPEQTVRGEAPYRRPPKNAKADRYRDGASGDAGASV